MKSENIMTKSHQNINKSIHMENATKNLQFLLKTVRNILPYINNISMILK